MATYREIASTETDAESPVTATLMDALRMNPEAITEGATNAPYSYAAWRPYNGVKQGDGALGRLYQGSIDGTVTEIVTPDFEDGYEYELRIQALSPTTQPVTLLLALYGQTDAAYGTSLTVSQTLTDTGGSVSGYIRMRLPRWQVNDHIVEHFTAILGGSSSAATETRGMRFSTAQYVLKARLKFSSGDIDAGRVWLFRRRAEIT